MSLVQWPFLAMTTGKCSKYHERSDHYWSDNNLVFIYLHISYIVQLA
jgi:hypothetical protein